ncbi:glutathione peroxidase [Pedomonas mirosovicensis]|uniref:glutathione peroxidase n=1 Tax=Pedomonas mirosovicensis TaxID=2908641 RepID=UPI002168DFE3|nr:glutathione peroxidase [Pedomonas mirosovicensis]MCH8683759.1 glutathione peroxidase [Pedomonas mirosovicensis]
MLKKIATVATALLTGGFAYSYAVHAEPVNAPDGRTAYDFTLTAIDGEKLPLSQFKGKVMLVVNTASKCGFTPQYEGLQAIHDKYAPKGFTVIGVPSGDFNDQEFDTNKEVKEFCETKFGITFPMAEKAHVKGDKATPLFRWAAETLGPGSEPKWNFHKYLVGRDGRLIGYFGTRVAPDSPELTSAIESALSEPAS